MPTITHYERLRELDDFVAIPLYIAFQVWTIAISATAGPVAVAVGVHMTGFQAPSRATSVAYGAAAIALINISLLGTISKTVSLTGWIPVPKRKQRRMVSTRITQRGLTTKTLHWEVDGLNCFGGGIVGAMLSSLTALVLVLLLFACYSGVIMAFVVGHTALLMKLLTGDVPSWTLVASLPACLCFLLLATTSGTRAPYQVVAGTLSGVVYSKLAEVYSHPLCDLRVGAAAGAAAGTMLWAGKLPIHLLNGTFWEYYQSEPRDMYISDENRWARRLFPPLVDVAMHSSIIELREAEKQAERAWATEAEELDMHPGWHRVFWSRPMGIDKVSHYVLIVNNHKYELRDVSAAHDRSQIQYRTAAVAFNIPDRHTAFLSELNNPTRGGGVYDLILIGWTNLTHEHIDTICRQVDRKWKYSFGFGSGNSGNCQHFVRKVADEIVSKGYRASNWDWFRHDRMGAIQLAQDAWNRYAKLLDKERADRQGLHEMHTFMG